MNIKGKCIEYFLCNKYIEIDKNNIECAIKLLYSKGYKWSANYHTLVYAINNYKHYINKDDVSYIRTYTNDNIFTFECYNTLDIETIIFNNMLRENKLKRILK